MTMPPPPPMPPGPPPMPMVPPGLYHDPVSGLLLPQGTTLATSGRRVGAYFLAIPLAIITLGIGYLIWGLVLWSKGNTPATKVLGMKVWRPETQSIPTFGQMALREVIGRYIAEGICLIIGLVSLVFMFSKPDRATIHDKIGGTVVLYDPNKVLG